MNEWHIKGRKILFFPIRVGRTGGVTSGASFALFLQDDAGYGNLPAYQVMSAAFALYYYVRLLRLSVLFSVEEGMW